VIEAETDRVYLGTKHAVEVEDGGLRRRIEVAKENSSTTVVWNSWIGKAKALSDFDDAEWTTMICIEASNVADFAVSLAPGAQHTMKTIVRVAAL
jgi:glucose-6-phosphate 1-epimerase